MTVGCASDLVGLRAIGEIVREAIAKAGAAARPGMRTAALDEVIGEILAQRGARSAPMLAYDFPGHGCISINDEAAHGIPGDRIIRDGDLVNIDVSAEKDGFFADSGASFPVGRVSMRARRLCEHTRRALERAMGAARAGAPVSAIAKAVNEVARSGALRVIGDLAGHGVGRALHEEPSIPNVPGSRDVLHEGLVITIEPFLTTGCGRIRKDADGWTLRTVDGGWCAQYEHTMVITKHAPIVIT
jgi:methionyl aminopeptidase